MTFSRPITALLLLIALPVMAFVWGRPGRLPAADFTFVLPKENSTVDPAAATSVSDGWIILALFDPLVRLDPTTLVPAPAAATSWSLSLDHLVYTFHLDPNGRWSDGTPVTATDFVESWRRVLAPETGCGFSFLLYPVAGAREVNRGDLPVESLGIRAIDELQFEVTLTEPVPYFVSIASHFALAPVRRDLITRSPTGWTAPDSLICNGPYRLELRRVRDRLRLRANDQHPFFERVGMRVIDALAIDDDNTALNLYLTGRVDWINAIPSLALPHLDGRDDLRLSTVLATNFLRFNVTRPPFDDVRLRRAVEQAINRDALCRYVYRGAERPAHAIVPPSLPNYTPSDGVPEDVVRARELLAEAGFPNGEGLDEIELLHSTDDAHRAVGQAIALRIRQQLGIRLRPVAQEFRVYLSSQRKLLYQVCIANWLGDYPDPSNFLELFLSDSSSNRTGWKDPHYDALMATAREAVDPKERGRRLRLAEDYLLTAGPIAPISYRGQVNLVSPTITGFYDNPLDLHPLHELGRSR